MRKAGRQLGGSVSLALLRSRFGLWHCKQDTGQTRTKMTLKCYFRLSKFFRVSFFSVMRERMKANNFATTAVKALVCKQMNADSSSNANCGEEELTLTKLSNSKSSVTSITNFYSVPRLFTSTETLVTLAVWIFSCYRNSGNN